MALEAPLRSSFGSQFSPFTSPLHREMSLSSPESDAQSPFITMSSASSERSTSNNANSLRPDSGVQRVPSNNHNSHNLMSPGDIVGPSPVTSNGTETTEIEDEEAEEASEHNYSEASSQPQLKLISTNIPEHLRQPSSEEAVSVIHAPENFQKWTSPPPKSEHSSARSSPKADDTASQPSQHSQPTVTQDDIQSPELPSNPPPLATNISNVRYSLDNSTPRAQDLQDMMSESSRLRSSSTSSLEKIDEIREAETDTDAGPDGDGYEDDAFATPGLPREQSEITALRTALQECWTLCNTLATLSSLHRVRVFNNSGTPDAHEAAWMACWKLCQRLYDNRDEAVVSFNVRESLDLCRDFCQSLFDIRQKKDEIADSILRVSFEMNNHLYSAQDSRNLPEAFRERTLDFYITLCHRLMKQRSELADETDSLLRACWSLAEMLFSLRQNKRDGKAPDEELLGSAVQACWELCDIFREGWTQVRPDRNTPRPSQTSFFSSNNANDHQSTTGTSTTGAGGRESRQSNRSSMSKRESHKSMSGSTSQQDDRPSSSNKRSQKQAPVPETPVTEFEDTPISPESQSPQVPNILVLGTNSDSGRGGRWSSSASNLSSYSQSSTKTSSTATTATAGEDVNVTRVKALMLKAAMNVGYVRDPSNDGKSGIVALQSFVKQLPNGSFGPSASNSALMQSYRNAVLGDAAFRGASSGLPSRGKRALAGDVAKSVHFMIQKSSHYTFLRDLFRLVFGFPVEEADSRKSVSIAI